MLLAHENSSPISREQVIKAYLQAIRLIDERVTPLLGKATTRVLVQVAAKRVVDRYTFLSFFMKMPYTEIVPAVITEQLSSTTVQELADGLNALLYECFAGLKELTGNIIVPPLQNEVTQQLKHLQ